jgi:hypothetical protein
VNATVQVCVQHTLEFDRIWRLPRRDWERDADSLVAPVTQALKTPGGRMQLYPIQATALKEAWENQGLLAPIRVGGGKTLLSLLLPKVLESQRPMLVLPAKLIEKTYRERADLARHWQIPNYTKILSYELLGRVSAKEELDRFAPDLLIFDEVHKLKSPKAAVTRRVKRFIEERRKQGAQLRVCAMSGTITRKSIRDYAHIAEWCLPNGCPVPTQWVDVENWANALDVLDTNPWTRVQPGALVQFVGPEDWREGADELTIIRRAYARRLIQTPGVVASGEDTLGTSLQLSALDCPPDPEIDRAFQRLRDNAELPDGWLLIDAVAVWAYARQLALGFYYVWDPRPPEAWLEARRNWTAFAREVIKTSIRSGRPCDSELDVALNYPEAPELREWQRLRDTFEPNVVPVWLSDSALVTAAKWLLDHPQGICWVKHVAFGQALERCTGIPFFHELGMSSAGKYIEDHNGPVIASIDSNRDGRNLQFKWKDNLIMTPPSGGLENEQLLGRTHRPGQVADEVTAEYYMGCIEDAEAFAKAVASAEYEQDTQRMSMKLCYADISIRPDDYQAKKGKRWQKTVVSRFGL